MVNPRARPRRLQDWLQLFLIVFMVTHVSLLLAPNRRLRIAFDLVERHALGVSAATSTIHRFVVFVPIGRKVPFCPELQRPVPGFSVNANAVRVDSDPERNNRESAILGPERHAALDSLAG